MQLKRGAAGSDDILWLLGIIGLIFFVWMSSGGPKRFESGGGGLFAPRATSSTRTTESQSSSRTPLSRRTRTVPPNASPWYGVVKLQKGSAASASDADEEYIVIQNTSRTAAVAISGWKLKNGRDKRLFINNLNQLVPGIPDEALIPLGANILYGSGINRLEPIMVPPRGKAIVTTGSISKRANFLGPSFRVNSCSGYINELPGYRLKPSLPSRCPLPRSEPGASLQEERCYTFIKRLRRCHAPVVHNEYVRSGESVEFIDRTTNLNSYCKQYLQNHFNYNWCIAHHSTDEDFLSNEWRVFLRRRLELWADAREVITLLDAEGRVVYELSY